MKKLFLFDIDGTLIRNSGHSSTFRHGIHEIYGTDGSIDRVNTQGMTDQGIIIESLILDGFSRELVLEKIDACIKKMVEYYRRDESIPDLIDGVNVTLEYLVKEWFCLWLVTGNIRDIWMRKLQKVGIDHFFSFGWFGDDDPDRSNLVRVAIGRAEEIYQYAFSLHDIYLIGDTPLDIQAWNLNSIKTVGVTTGEYNEDNLRQHCPDYIIWNIKELLSIVTPDKINSL